MHSKPPVLRNLDMANAFITSLCAPDLKSSRREQALSRKQMCSRKSDSRARLHLKTSSSLDSPVLDTQKKASGCFPSISHVTYK